MTEIRPLAETAETVTLSRSDWTRLLAEREDAQDIEAVRARHAHEAALGVDAARRDYLTAEEAARLLDGESPVKVWREKRGLSRSALATQASVSQRDLSEVEAGKKPGSAEALLRIGRTLDVPMEHLVGA